MPFSFNRNKLLMSKNAQVDKEVLTGSAALDFPSIATTAQATLTITVAGAAVGDFVFITPQSTPTAGLTFDCWVSAANTVTVRAQNLTAGAIDAASTTWKAYVVKATNLKG